MTAVLDAESTVADLVARHMLVRATCTTVGCAHSRLIDPARVCFHPAGTVSRLGRVLRCRGCGRQGMATRAAFPHEGVAT